MTRFWITLEQSAALVLNVMRDMQGGEVWVPRIPSMKIVDLAEVISPGCDKPILGIRSGEKLHEMMIPVDDGRLTLAFKTHFIINPSFPSYCSDVSDNSKSWVSMVFHMGLEIL